jgi:Arc/MetJ family transcription regulator
VSISENEGVIQALAANEPLVCRRGFGEGQDPNELPRPTGLSGSPSSHERVGGLSRDRPAALLTDLHHDGTLMHMRTTLNIDDRLLTEARRLSGLKVKTAVLHAGLEALIARESAKRLATLGGHERRLKPIPRRRTARRG